MARDIYQIGIDAVEFIESREKKEELDNVLLLEDYEEITDYDIYQELLDYNNEVDSIGELEYPCVVCDELTALMCDPNEFDPDMHYCGRSPSCCP
jgi:hypothetical protein